MNDSFKANVNVSQAYRHLGLDKFAPTRAVYNRLPKSIRNFSWKHQFKAPTKLGVRDGYRAPNRGGKTTAANTRDQLSALRIRSDTPGFTPRDMQYRGENYRERESRLKDDMNRRQEEYNREKEQFAGTDGWLDFYRPENQKKLRQDTEGYRGFPRPVRGIPRPVGPERTPMPVPDRGGPQQDWLSSLYSSHNISGGKLDQSARDYWSKEAETKGRDAVMRSIIGTSKAQGTYGGRKRPKRINTGPRRQFPKGRGVGPLPLDPRFAGRGPKTGKPRRGRGGHGGGLPAHALGMATRHWKRSTPKGKVRPRGKNPRGRGFFPTSLAATMASFSGGF